MHLKLAPLVSQPIPNTFASSDIFNWPGKFFLTAQVHFIIQWHLCNCFNQTSTSIYHSLYSLKMSSKTNLIILFFSYFRVLDVGKPSILPSPVAGSCFNTNCNEVSSHSIFRPDASLLRFFFTLRLWVTNNEIKNPQQQDHNFSTLSNYVLSFNPRPAFLHKSARAFKPS